MSRCGVTIPDLAQKKSRASQGEIKIGVRSAECGARNRTAQKSFLQAEMRSSKLRPRPRPAMSSVGNSPTAWKLFSKLATNGPEINDGRTDKPCWFHQPAKGNRGGRKLLNNNTS